MSENNHQANFYNRGITLIALVVTVVVTIIIATIAISTLTSEDGVIKNAEFAAFATKIREYEENVDKFVIEETEKNWSSLSGVQVTNPDKMKDILGDTESGDENKYVIQEDELRYNPDTVTDEEEAWLIELGILAMTSLFVITFMANGSVFKTIQTNKITFPEVYPTSGAGNFAGWYYDQELNNQAIEGEEVTGNITLYAKFGDFVATFIANDEVFQTIEGSSLRFPSTDPTKSNVKFVGWYYDKEGTRQAKTGDILTGNTTLYAKWTSYIKNKLNGKYIYMLDYETSGSSGWYYVENFAELKEIPYYDKVINTGGGNAVNNLPAWVKLGKYSIGDTLYTYEGSNEIVNAKLTMSNMTGEMDFAGNFDLAINNVGKVTFASGFGAIYTARVKVEVTFNDGTTDTDEFFAYIHNACFVEGTDITLADMSKKKIENITYDDELLVWDFDNGFFTNAKPLWIMKAQRTEEYNLIKFDDGTELKTVIDHRIFNVDKQKFTYTMNEEDTPIGTKVFKDDGTTTKIIERSIVKETANYYNIITDYHMNLFANGILTSLRLNNLYKIENMKFIKDCRKLNPREEFKDIPDKYFYGLRLAEQSKEINSKNDVKHANTLQEYVKRLLNSAK